MTGPAADLGERATERAPHAPVLVIDSGLGGLLVARAFRASMPDRDLVVVADHAGAPYGPLTQQQLIDRLDTVVREQRWCEPAVVVLACNTATVSAIAILRERFDLPFVGFEPAVKPASLQSARRSIGVLATAGSLAAERFRWLCDTYAPGVTVTTVAAPELVGLVESDAPAAERLATVTRCVQPLVEAGVDAVALGCTHFPYLRPELEAALGPGVTLLDPTPAVASRTQQLLPDTPAVGPALDVIVDTDPALRPATLARWQALLARAPAQIG